MDQREERAWPLDLKDKPSLRTPHSFAPCPLWVAMPASAAGSFCRTRAVSQALSSLANSHLSQEEEEGEEQAVKVALISAFRPTECGEKTY